jgi:hypothetical protein
MARKALWNTPRRSWAGDSSLLAGIDDDEVEDDVGSQNDSTLLRTEHANRVRDLSDELPDAPSTPASVRSTISLVHPQWSHEEDASVIAGVDAGQNAKEIVRLHGLARSPSAVRNRIVTLKLRSPARRSPRKSVLPSPRRHDGPEADQEGAESGAGMASADETPQDILPTINEEVELEEERRQSTGKLKRPSTAVNPPYRNPKILTAVIASQAMQRKLQPVHRARPDTYDLGDSPEKVTPQLRARRGGSAQAFSPLKKHKKAPKVAALMPLADHYRETQQQIDEQVFSEASGREGAQDVLSQSTQPRRSVTSEAVDVEQAQASGGADSGVRDAHANALGPEVIGNIGELELTTAQPDSPALSDDGVLAASSKPGKKRGRPRKSNVTRTSKKQLDANAAQLRRIAEQMHANVALADADTEEGEPDSHTDAQNPAKKQHGRRSRLESDVQEHVSHEIRPVAQPELDDSDVDEHVPSPEDEAEEDVHSVEEQNEAREMPKKITEKPKQQVTIARASELFGPGASGDLSIVFGPSPEKPSTTSKRRREEPDDAPAANTSRKRQRHTPTFEADDSVHHGADETFSDAERKRFFGEWPDLRGAMRATADVGVQHKDGERQPVKKIILRDDAVQAIMNSCNDALTKVINGEEPASDFVEVAKGVDALYQSTDEVKPDFENVVRMKNIYFHLFPTLVRFVVHLAQCYENADAGVEPGSPLTRGHLRNVKQLVKVILDLGEGVKKYIKPSSDLCLLGPVRNGMLAPLKKVYTSFARALTELESAEAHRRLAEHEALQRAQDAQREEMEDRQRARIRKAKEKWEGLHFERRCAEGGMLGRTKIEHLATPTPWTPEYDHNGEPFERIELFHPRIGPSPAKVEEARSSVWPLVQLAALEEGLRKYAGKDVYEKIFRTYCPRGAALSAYNVTEIVTTSADMKEYLTQMQQGEDGIGEVQAWVKAIPVWTSGHPLGKENTGEIGEEEDAEMIDEGGD